MREPKYQAWLGNVMVQVTSINIMKYPSGEYARPSRGYYLDGENKGSSIDFDLNKAKLREFTGLKGKNGVEIYEGDILLFNNSINDRKWKCVVEYREGSFVCVYQNDKVYNHFDSWNVPKVTWEVIGNIYENPDLLEESHA